ncbi:MAG: hypothetical protein JJU13_10760 [Balneolaceae bacterium]|nr:hypothetical protein [Balneolaceae bacterium]
MQIYSRFKEEEIACHSYGDKIYKLNGRGAIRVNEENEVVRLGGVKYTIKDGILFDAKQLLKDVEEMVRESKEELDFRITQPGLDY